MIVIDGQKYFVFLEDNVMKLMKRIVSIALCAVLLVSAACMMVSCNDDEATPIDTINGVAPAEACFVAFAQLVAEEHYHVTVDANIMINALVTTVPVGVDGFYDYTLDGDNMHYKFTDKDLLFIDNAKLLSIFSGYDKEVWYVDGVRYAIAEDGTPKADKSGRKPSNVVDKIIDTIESSDRSDAACYEQDGEKFVMLTVTLDEFGAGEVGCKVFIDGNGDITRAVVEGKLYGIGVKLTMNFAYDNVPAIEVPEDMLALA